MSRTAQLYVCEKCGQQFVIAGIQQTFEAVEKGLNDPEHWPDNLTYMVSPEFTTKISDHRKVCDGEIKRKKMREMNDFKVQP